MALTGLLKRLLANTDKRRLVNAYLAKSEVAPPDRFDLSDCYFFSLTPAPPGASQFSAMNSTPADSRAERMSLRR
jgi:hypothetical protein